MTEAWFDERTASLVGGGVGSLVGVWGAAVGVLSGLLIPRCRGRRLLFGLLGTGVAAGLVMLVTGGVAVAAGQPYRVWYPLLTLGLLLGVLGGAFLPITAHRYRLAETERMARLDAV